MKRVTKEQKSRLGNLAKKHYHGDGSWDRVAEQLIKEANLLLGVGRGRKKQDGLRTSRPKQEALFSSDYIDRVPLRGAVA